MLKLISSLVWIKVLIIIIQIVMIYTWNILIFKSSYFAIAEKNIDIFVEINEQKHFP